jgi:hypothetical protein
MVYPRIYHTYTIHIPYIWMTSTYVWYIPYIYHTYTKNWGSRCLPPTTEKVMDGVLSCDSADFILIDFRLLDYL